MIHRDAILRVMSSAPVIAILDDEKNMRIALGRLLRAHGHPSVSFSTGPELIAACRERSFACILLDLQMPSMDGFAVLEKASSLARRQTVIIVTGHDEAGSAERALAMGADAYLTKPIDEQPLLDAIRAATCLNVN